MKRMVEIIEAVAEEDPTQKILIFSQFTSFLEIVSKDLFQQGIPHETYVGSSEFDTQFSLTISAPK